MMERGTVRTDRYNTSIDTAVAIIRDIDHLPKRKSYSPETSMVYIPYY